MTTLISYPVFTLVLLLLNPGIYLTSEILLQEDVGLFLKCLVKRSLGLYECALNNGAVFRKRII